MFVIKQSTLEHKFWVTTLLYQFVKYWKLFLISHILIESMKLYNIRNYYIRKKMIEQYRIILRQQIELIQTVVLPYIELSIESLKTICNNLVIYNIQHYSNQTFSFYLSYHPRSTFVKIRLVVITGLGALGPVFLPFGSLLLRFSSAQIRFSGVDSFVFKLTKSQFFITEREKRWWRKSSNNFKFSFIMLFWTYQAEKTIE